jgi:hypothetical protein
MMAEKARYVSSGDDTHWGTDDVNAGTICRIKERQACRGNAGRLRQAGRQGASESRFGRQVSVRPGRLQKAGRHDTRTSSEPAASLPSARLRLR